MAEVIRWMLGLMLRLSLLLAGLVFFASLMAVATAVLMLWLLRALWATVTGRPVQPWVFKMSRRPPWQRGGFPGTPPSKADNVVDAEVRVRHDDADVTDVQAKRIERQ
jgi:uncharacterized protein (DUF58 family)